VTLQDAGRSGWRRFGVTGSGAMDRSALALANALVGNRTTEPALEFAYAGGEWLVEAPACRIAVTGCVAQVTIDGVPLRPYESALLGHGQRLRIGSDPGKVWGYLAVAGGFDAPLSFGSRATHTGTNIGGWTGGTIQAGEALPLRLGNAAHEPDRAIVPLPDDGGPFRVVLGPQSDFLDDASIARFLTDPWRMTWQQDRMAYRVEGPTLRHTKGFNIVSDGVLPGCIQIMGTGHPLILMRDAGTNGGYPKIGMIIDADLDRFAQTRPGTTIHFSAVGVEEAQLLRRRYLARLQTMTARLGTLPA
jgi:5-oxoprolinase (ATP-hydrolysing) subunit C